MRQRGFFVLSANVTQRTFSHLTFGVKQESNFGATHTLGIDHFLKART